MCAAHAQVYDVVYGILRAKAEAFDRDYLPSDNPSDYEVKVADDDGTTDPDYPEVDPRAAITSVGTTKFVLCEAGTGRECVQLCIPEQSVAYRAYDADPVLAVTCRPVNGAFDWGRREAAGVVAVVAGVVAEGVAVDDVGDGAAAGEIVHRLGQALQR